MEYLNNLKRKFKKELEYTRKGLAGFSTPGSVGDGLLAGTISVLGGFLTGGCAYSILYVMEKIYGSITGEATNPLLPAISIGVLTGSALFLGCAREFGKHISERAPKAYRDAE